MSFNKTRSLFILLLILIHPTLSLAICSETPDKFNEWMSDAREQALKKGINADVVNKVFSNIKYRDASVSLDRKMFTAPPLSFQEYISGIAISNIIERGKKIKKEYQVLFQKIQKDYGVPAGILITLWGLESRFGDRMGEVPTFSTLATLAYDCRRSALFTEQFFVALELVNQGIISAESRGALHGEIGPFQFLPSNVKKFSVDGDGDGKASIITSNIDAIESAANFLKKNGWTKNKGYQPEEKNFLILKRWNNSTNYIKAVAYIAAHIDGIKLKDGYQ
ncbi:membrane-bound lytic murein transglycosylase B [Candidatus Liberibacter solanacearum]|uniref:lytic murein transglycosylase n=1 Tax=Candidatus Liberibacter solanacearum TaxID=556287 RepID=UPI0038720381